MEDEFASIHCNLVGRSKYATAASSMQDGLFMSPFDSPAEA